MNPKSKGWLKKYADYFKQNTDRSNYIEIIEILKESSSFDQFLYAAIQPTGLLYGHPVKFATISSPRLKEWGDKEKVKLILVENLLNTGLLLKRERDTDEPVSEDEIQEVISKIKLFYEGLWPQYLPKEKNFVGKERSDDVLLEKILSKRVKIKKRISNFWVSFFHNSFLFLDLYLFKEWLEKDLSYSQLSVLSDELRLKVLRVIALAANSDKVVVQEEKEMYSYFLNSAGLSVNIRKKAADFLEECKSITQISFSCPDSWLLKKYFLEIAVMTIWADKEVDDLEMEFLAEFSTKLGLCEEDMDSSLLALESFVLENWEDVPFLQKKKSFNVLSSKMKKQMNITLKKYKGKLNQEVDESKELVTLLKKSRSEELTDEEKKKVKAQTLDLLKTIPTFAIWLTPGSTFTLPILLKILPNHLLLPSAFTEEDEFFEEKEEG